jgi:hypothetical protein
VTTRVHLQSNAADAADPRVASAAERLRFAFAFAAARENVHARLDGDASAMRITFDGQEDAPADVMLHHFLLELEKAGAVSHGWIHPQPDWDDATIAVAAAALDRALTRIRILLVEHNSWTSGGVPYVFATDDAVLRERGLAWYRFPKRGAVELSARDGVVRIAFAAGDVGAITSSGFYVPTRIHGDFTATIGYRLGTFDPGPDSACLALFQQNEASTVRVYAQLTCTPTCAGRVFVAQAGLRGGVTSPLPADAGPGAFRLRRAGRRVTAWHRSGGGDWRELGAVDDDPGDDAILGCKIWTKVACGGLVAELHDFTVAGRVADDPGAPADVRPDPLSRR